MKRLFILAALTITLSSQAQPWVQMSIGNTNEFFSHELQAGYRAAKTFVSVGYISLLNNSQPTLFNVRGGAILNERWLVYAGAVRSIKSTERKHLNQSTWQAGVQYHFFFYDAGTFYVTAAFTNTTTARVSTGIGMSFNLFK
jgi:hypothetical protein